MNDGGSGAGLAAIVGVLLLAAVYFLPTIVAMSRQHHQIGPVIVINLLLGWTIIGWIVAMVIATSAKREPVRHQHYYGQPYQPQGYPPPGYPAQGHPTASYPAQGQSQWTPPPQQYAPPPQDPVG